MQQGHGGGCAWRFREEGERSILSLNRSRACPGSGPGSRGEPRGCELHMTAYTVTEWRRARRAGDQNSGNANHVPYASAGWAREPLMMVEGRPPRWLAFPVWSKPCRGKRFGFPVTRHAMCRCAGQGDTQFN